MSIPKFVPISKAKDSDIQKIEKFVKIITELQNLLGITIKQRFILSYVFPEYSPSDIAEGFEEEEQTVGFYSYEDLQKLGILTPEETQNEEKTKETESEKKGKGDEENKQQEENILSLISSQSSIPLTEENLKMLKQASVVYKHLKKKLNSGNITDENKEIIQSHLDNLSKFIQRHLVKNIAISDLNFIPFF